MTDDSKQEKKCPKCGHVGPVDTDFGTRTVNGKTVAQIWCKACRAVVSR